MKFYKIEKEVINSVLMGVVFMIVYSAFYSFSNLEKLLLQGTHDNNSRFSGDGFVSQSILYVSFALFMWLVPPLVSLLGPKWTLTLGTLGFCLLMLSLLPELAWLLYLGSFCNGVGAAMLWTSQAVYIILNSTAATITRNSAIVAGLCHSSMVYGNLFIFFSFNKTTFDKETRTFIVLTLLSLTMVAVLFAAVLPPPAYAQERAKYKRGPLQEMKQSLAIAKSKDMLVLTPMFLYTGLQISFLCGIHGAAVGFTTYSDNFPSYKLVALTGIFTGIGEILAGVFLVLVNSLLSARPRVRSLIVVLGIFSDCSAFLLSFLNYSNDSVFSPTTDPTIIVSRSWIALIIAVLLGFSDGIFMPMLISLVGKIHPSGNASTVTIYTFCFSFGAAVSFFYSVFIGLHWQLLILTVEGILGAACYCYVNENT